MSNQANGPLFVGSQLIRIEVKLVLAFPAEGRNPQVLSAPPFLPVFPQDSLSSFRVCREIAHLHPPLPLEFDFRVPFGEPAFDLSRFRLSPRRADRDVRDAKADIRRDS